LSGRRSSISLNQTLFISTLSDASDFSTTFASPSLITIKNFISAITTTIDLASKYACYSHTQNQHLRRSRRNRRFAHTHAAHAIRLGIGTFRGLRRDCHRPRPAHLGRDGSPGGDRRFTFERLPGD